MSNKDELLRVVTGDYKYKQILGAVDKEIADGIQKTVEAMVDKLGKSLDELSEALRDPETQQLLKEALRSGAAPLEK